MKPAAYSFVAPDGSVHTGNNLRAFCRLHTLDYSNIYQVLMGARKHHKGFTAPESGYVRTYSPRATHDQK
jgi:hypothetical protein